MPNSPFKLEDPLTPSLTPLEQAVMNNILKGEHPILVALRKQLEGATIFSREFSGVGFFTNFKFSPNAPPLPEPIKGLAFGDVEADIKGLQHGAGFVLFVKNGFLLMLEGYTYDEPWPMEADIFKLKYHEPDRKKLFEYLDEKLKG
jgi:hypothetical protein